MKTECFTGGFSYPEIPEYCQGGDAGTRRWGDAGKHMVNIRHFRELRVYQTENGCIRIETG